MSLKHKTHANKTKKKYITYENRDLRVQKLQVIKNNNGPEMNNIYSSQRGKNL